jgi:hypothetical protein
MVIRYGKTKRRRMKYTTSNIGTNDDGTSIAIGMSSIKNFIRIEDKVIEAKIEIFPSEGYIAASPWFNEYGKDEFELVGFKNPVKAMNTIVDMLIELESAIVEMYKEEYVEEMRIVWPSVCGKRKKLFNRIAEKFKDKTTIKFLQD